MGNRPPPFEEQSLLTPCSETNEQRDSRILVHRHRKQSQRNVTTRQSLMSIKPAKMTLETDILSQTTLISNPQSPS